MMSICVNMSGTSWFFFSQIMLMSPQWSECKESRIVLGETPACAEVFDRFLQYFYTGHICVDSQTVMPILTLADKYNIKVIFILVEPLKITVVPYFL